MKEKIVITKNLVEYMNNKVLLQVCLLIEEKYPNTKAKVQGINKTPGADQVLQRLHYLLIFPYYLIGFYS